MRKGNTESQKPKEHLGPETKKSKARPPTGGVPEEPPRRGNQDRPDRQTDRQADGQTDRQAGKQTDRQTDTHTHTHTLGGSTQSRSPRRIVPGYTITQRTGSINETKHLPKNCDICSMIFSWNLRVVWQ